MLIQFLLFLRRGRDDSYKSVIVTSSFSDGGGGDCPPQIPIGTALLKKPVSSVYPVPKNTNILRTFEVKILKIIKNIQPQPQNYAFS